MYNRILKRPMFRRGGMGYSAQGSGITSGMDTPRPRYYGGGTIGGGMIHGNPMGNRTGFDDPTLKRLQEIGTEKKEIFETPKGQWLDDVIGSFGAYASPYKDDGTAKTTGEMGWEQAQEIKKIRDARKDKQDLAALSGLESEETLLLKQQEQAADLNTKTLIQELANQGAIDVENIRSNFDNTATGGMIREIKNRKDLSQDQKHKMIESVILKSNQPKLIINLATAIMDNASANMKTIKLEDAMKAATNAIMLMLADVGLPMAKGGRVGYQLGTSQTGAMPVQQASATEEIVTPNADITETETVTEGQQSTVQMPYQEFRAAIPAEVSDEIVQLIYYNEDAFADFSQIASQEDVYAFNNKYGVSLVLPMDTETT